MQKKLTLSIDEKLIIYAHDYSKKSKQSISHLFEEYLKKLQSGEQDAFEFSVKTERLYGTLQEEVPDKKALRKKFHEKSNH